MFGHQIRAARLALHLSEARLARDAKIQRSQLNDAENDRNITTDTLKKILAQLPNLTHLTIQPGAVPEMGTDVQTIRELTAQAMAALQRLMAAAGGAPPADALPVQTSNVQEVTEVVDDVETRGGDDAPSPAEPETADVEKS